MKRISVWQKVQAVIAFLLILCVLAPLGMIAVKPDYAANLLGGVLILDEPLIAAVQTVTLWQRIAFGVVVLIGLISAIKLLSVVFTRGKHRRKGVALQNAAEGELHISVPAIETLISQGIRDVQGLSDIRMKVTDMHEFVTIDMTLNARSDIDIPETMMQLQTRIKNYIEESAGVEVREVRINVDRVIRADNIQALPSAEPTKKADDASLKGGMAADKETAAASEDAANDVDTVGRSDQVNPLETTQEFEPVQEDVAEVAQEFESVEPLRTPDAIITDMPEAVVSDAEVISDTSEETKTEAVADDAGIVEDDAPSVDDAVEAAEAEAEAYAADAMVAAEEAGVGLEELPDMLEGELDAIAMEDVEPAFEQAEAELPADDSDDDGVIVIGDTSEDMTKGE